MPEWPPRLAVCLGRDGASVFDVEAILDMLKGALRLAVCIFLGDGSVFDCGADILDVTVATSRFASVFFCGDDAGAEFVTGIFAAFGGLLGGFSLGLFCSDRRVSRSISCI
jgi:hypothetical protein